MSEKTRLMKYETEKKRLLGKGLSAAEYEKEVKKLCRKFKI